MVDKWESLEFMWIFDVPKVFQFVDDLISDIV